MKLFFFSYQEEFDADYFGVAWYLTTLIRLYMVAPLFIWLIEKWKQRKGSLLVAYAGLVAAGLLIRLAMHQYILAGENRYWAIMVYKPWYINIDFFVGGMLLNELKDGNLKRNIPVLPWVLLIACNLFLSREHFYTSYYSRTEPLIYQYLGPTVYLLITSFFILNYDVIKVHPAKESRLVRSLAKGAEWIGQLLMPMYLFHTIIAQKVLVSNTNWYGYVAEALRIPQGYQTFAVSCLYAGVALVYTILWSALVHYGMEPGVTRCFENGLDRCGRWVGSLRHKH